MARKKVVINPIVGRRIKQLRKEKNLSQAELAQKLNYDSGNTVLYWENGRSPVPADILVKLANIFEVSIYYLLGKTDCLIDWEKFDDEHLDILSAIQQETHFEEYLKSIGFEINIEPDGKSAIYTFSKDGKQIPISAESLKQLQNSIANYIEFEFFKLIERKD